MHPSELERAQNKYRQFVRSLQEPQPRHDVFTADDLPKKKIVNVPRQQAVNVFLSLNPHFGAHREELVAMFSETPEFQFDEETWEETLRRIDNQGQSQRFYFLA